MIGIVVVAAFAALCVVAALTAQDKTDETGQAAASSFVDAWKHSRTGTYALTGTYVRRAPGRSTMRSPVRLVQRPPNRLLFQFGEVTGRIGRQPVICGPKGPCRRGPVGRTYEEDSTRQLAIVAQYIGGAAPRYTVERRGSCFTLRLVRGLPAAYGDESLFCFDRATGAPVRIRVRNRNVVEERTTTHLTGTVRSSDFRVRGLSA